MTNMVRTLIENQNVCLPRKDMQEPRIIVQEDRKFLPRGVRLDSPHFNGGNPSNWVFKVN